MKRQITAAFVCLPCKKVFKRATHVLVGESYQEIDPTPKCPDCGAVMVGVGDTFRAPPRADVKAWEQVETEIRRGRKFTRDEGFGKTPSRSKKAEDL